MHTSDFVKFGAGLALGSMMSRTLGNVFTQAMDAHSSMRVLTVPRTRPEIENLLDQLDVRLANGEISETIYNTLTVKWQARLPETPSPSS